MLNQFIVKLKVLGFKLVEGFREELGIASQNIKNLFGKRELIIAEAFDEINHLKPMLEACGFFIGDISVQLTIPPGVTVIIEQIEGREADFSKIEEMELTIIQKNILITLSKVQKIGENVYKKGYTAGQIELGLSIPPTLKVHFNSLESRAFSSEAVDTDLV